MKKTFSRAFSLLLVLALLASVIPSALAAEHTGALSITSTGDATEVTVGGSPISLSAALTGEYAGTDIANATWNWSGSSDVSITPNGSSATVSASSNVTEQKTVTITATATVEEHIRSDRQACCGAPAHPCHHPGRFRNCHLWHPPHLDGYLHFR